MKTKNFLLLVFIIACLTVSYHYLLDQKDLIYMQGYIIPERTTEKIYLQDIESGNYTLLKFAYDDYKNLEFDDMEFVEVIGYYKSDSNVLDVEIIHDLQSAMAYRE